MGVASAGYNGVASLAHARDGCNVFVPALAGLNLELIHDGTLTVAPERFEPGTAPMVPRVVDAHSVGLYQQPMPTLQLESCGPPSTCSRMGRSSTRSSVSRVPIHENAATSASSESASA